VSRDLSMWAYQRYVTRGDKCSAQLAMNPTVVTKFICNLLLTALDVAQQLVQLVLDRLARKLTIVAPERRQFWTIIDTEAASSFLWLAAIQSVERI